MYSKNVPHTTVILMQRYFKVSLEDGHLGQATPHDILYVHCELSHLFFCNVICREINFDLI